MPGYQDLWHKLPNYWFVPFGFPWQDKQWKERRKMKSNKLSWRVLHHQMCMTLIQFITEIIHISLCSLSIRFDRENYTYLHVLALSTVYKTAVMLTFSLPPLGIFWCPVTSSVVLLHHQKKTHNFHCIIWVLYLTVNHIPSKQ